MFFSPVSLTPISLLNATLRLKDQKCNWLDQVFYAKCGKICSKPNKLHLEISQ